jgi:hypothetical protein
MTLIDEVLQRPEFTHEPPVLVDVGAAGGTHEDWAPIAKYSVCLAFDADERELGQVDTEDAGFRRLLIHRAVVTASGQKAVPFFLTRSPYCSSTLKPCSDKLSDYAFARLFDVETTRELRAETLNDALAAHGLRFVDWFKTDSQGTDLRLFRSLGDERIARVLAADFEPGIIDAYDGEDKLHHVLAFMDGLPFWMHEMNVQSVERVAPHEVQASTQGVKRRPPRKAPGWAEVAYFNTLRGNRAVSTRDLMLAWVFASIKQQHGFALELATQAEQQHSGEAIFRRLVAASRQSLAPSWTGFARTNIERVLRRVTKGLT